MEQSTAYVFLLQLAATLLMTGVIWFVQIVHYPLMQHVGRSNFRRYEMEHQRLTTWVVAPLMLTEVVTAILMFWWRPPGVDDFFVWIGLGLLGSIWLMTYTVQVPQHTSLLSSCDPLTQRRLVQGNWVRTIAWTARSGLVLWMGTRMIAELAATING